MGYKSTFIKIALLIPALLFLNVIAHAQNCTVNAGTPQQYCNVTSFNLTGKQGGDVSGSPVQWTQVGGSPALTINNPTSLNTSVTNVVPGVFVFRLSIQCADGVTNFNDITITILPPPTLALAGPDQQVCTTSPVSLAANSTSGSEVGRWSIIFGDGSLSNANSPTSTFTPSGKGIFQLEWEIDNGNCSTKDTVIISVTGGTQPVSAGPDKTISCAGNSTSLDGTDPGLPPQSALWTFISGPSIPNIQNPSAPQTTVGGLIPGTYVFRYAVNGTCFSGADEVTVTVLDIKASPASGGNKTQTFCQSDNVTQVLLNAGPFANPDETGQWTQTAGPAATIVSPNTPTTQVNGLNGSSQYSFQWTISNSGGCSSTATHQIVFVPDFSTMSNPPGQTLACKKDSAFVNIQYDYGGITSGTGLTRTGKLISSPLTNSSGVKITRSGPVGNDTWTISGLDSAGVYSFQFEYRNACSSTFRNVNILASDTAAISNAGSDEVLPCNTFTTTLVAADVPDGQGTGIWTKVSGPPANIQNPNASTTPVVLTIAGNYVFRWSISNGPGCASQTNEVIVTSASLNIDTINAGPDTSICSGVSYVMRALVPDATIVGTWSNFPGNVTISNVNDPHAVISNLNPGQTIEFVWTLSNACGIKRDTVVITATSSSGIQANAGPDQCLPSGTTTVQLNGNDPGSGIPFWTSLDGAPLNGTQQQNPIATIPSNGTYRFVYNIQSPGCGINQDTVIVTVSAPTSSANAGTDQNICAPSLPTSATLNATPPAAGTGTWTQISGVTATIVNPSLPNTQVNNLSRGIYDFAFTITNGVCSSNADTVRLVISQEPSATNAGPDQDLCDITTGTNVQLNATPVSNGAGVWTVVSTPGGAAPIFSDVTSPTSTVRNLQNGTTVLRWSTASGPGCPVFFDEVSLNVSARANANTTASGVCNVTTVTLIGNINTDGTWTQVSGPNTATITNDNPNTFSAIASNMITGVYIFRYTLPAVGSCAASQDDVTVTISESPTVADAGPDKSLCPGTSTTSLTGNTPTVGTPSWTRISGPNTPTESGANTTTISLSGLIPGIYIYQYSISNGSCPVSTDNIAIAVTNDAVAGPDQTQCAATSITLAGNSPVFYTGTWTQVSGPNTANILNAGSPNSGVDNLVPGTYVFKWTINTPDSCGVNDDDVTVVIDPPLDITGLAGPDQTVCEGGASITIGSASGPIGVTYSWQPTSLLSDPNSLQTTFTGTGAGVFTYTLTGTRGSCTSTDQVTITVNQVPVQPVLNGPTNICIDATTTVTVASVQSGVTYNWSAGLGTGTSKVVSPGTYTVTPVFDVGGCSGTPASITITGDPLPTTAAAGTDQDICQGVNTATLTGNIAVVGSPLWTQVSGPNSASITPAPATRVIDIGGLIAGVYTFEYSITSGTCPPSTDEVIVTKEVMAAAGNDQRLCNAASTNLTGTTPFIYPGQWTQVSKPAGVPDATIVSPNNPSTVVNGLSPGAALSGTYVFRWTIESGGACPVNFDEVSITIDAPVATPNAGANVTQCEGDATVINVGSAPVAGLVYSWSPATNLANPNVSQTTFTGTAPGRYDYTLTATNGNCSNSDNVSVIINPLVATPIISAPLAACSNSTVTVSITNADPDADYTWRQGATIVANGAQVNLGPGSYTVTPTSVSGCVGAAVPLTLTSLTPPVAAFTATTSDSCIFTFLASNINPANTYTFYFSPDGRPLLRTGPGPFEQVYGSVGLKRNFMEVVDQNGCRDTMSNELVANCSRDFPLPLRLLSFDGAWIGNNPELTWRFDQSVDMSHFELERSNDGIRFSAIARLPITNSTTLVQQYRYTDSTATGAGRVYFYRLKMVENTGVITYSKTVRLESQQLLTIKANPNPFTDRIQTMIVADRVEKAKLDLLSLNGVIVKTQTTQLQRGVNYIELRDLQGMAQGLYFLRIQIDNKITTIKLQKL